MSAARGRSRTSGTTRFLLLAAVIGVVLAFGFMGLFLGPTLLAVAYSLISDYFPRAERGTALAIYSLGVPIGSALGILPGGGAILASFASYTMEKKLSKTPEEFGRGALAGVAGLVVGQMLSNNRQVALNTGDRVIVTRPDGSQEVIKNDNALLLRPGATVQTENFQDGSTRTSVLREDGSRVVTIRDADLRVLRRSLVRADGTVTTLIDDTVEVEPVDVATLPAPAPGNSPAATRP